MQPTEQLESCPDCGGLQSKVASACPHCGRERPTPPMLVAGMGIGAVVGGFIGLVLGGCIGLLAGVLVGALLGGLIVLPFSIPLRTPEGGFFTRRKPKEPKTVTWRKR